MADEMMMEGEKKEEAGLNEILTMAQSGDPSVLPKIAEIAQSMLGMQQEEEQAIAPKGEEANPMVKKVMSRIEQNRQGGEENA